MKKYYVFGAVLLASSSAASAADVQWVTNVADSCCEWLAACCAMALDCCP